MPDDELAFLRSVVTVRRDDLATILKSIERSFVHGDIIEAYNRLVAAVEADD